MLPTHRPTLCWPVYPLLTAVLIFGLVACGQTDKSSSLSQSTSAMPPPPVTLQTVVLEPATIYRDYAGRLRGSREVEVRARVGGILIERLYNEGQTLKKGTPLFRIDPKPFEITLDQRKAELATAKATLNQSEREWRRISGLFEQKVASESNRDQALSVYELAKAQLQGANARLAEAKLNLEYTVVKAPIAGVVGLETLSEGSLITVGALLTTIIQKNPVQVRFSIPEKDAQLYRELVANQSITPLTGIKPITLWLSDGQGYAHPGEVNFTDSVIDPRTGTVSVRAVFPNPDMQLIPGQFVRIRLIVAEIKQAVKLPSSAIGEGSSSPQVYLMNPDLTVALRPVKLGPIMDGKQIILEGLATGDKVVINGQSGLREGMTVRPVDPT